MFGSAAWLWVYRDLWLYKEIYKKVREGLKRGFNQWSFTLSLEVTLRHLKYYLYNHVDCTESCNRVNGVCLSHSAPSTSFWEGRITALHTCKFSGSLKCIVYKKPKTVKDVHQNYQKLKLIIVLFVQTSSQKPKDPSFSMINDKVTVTVTAQYSNNNHWLSVTYISPPLSCAVKEKNKMSGIPAQFIQSGLSTT